MNTKQMDPDLPEGARAHTSQLMIALFWLLTVLPLAWGVYHTVLQALQLLR